MRVTKQIQITTPKLVSSTVAEPYVLAAYNAGSTYAFGDLVSVAADFAHYESLDDSNTGNTPLSSPLWWRKIGVTEDPYNSGTTYGLGATVSSSISHRCYESRQAGNTGKPLPVLPEIETDWWRDVGSTMRHAMFDLARSTQTVCPSPLTVVVDVNERFNTIGLTRIRGNTLMIKVTSVTNGGTIFPLAYSADRTYAKGECMTVGLSQSYQSLADDNIGHPAPDAAWWSPVAGAIYDLNTRKAVNATEYISKKFSTRPSKTIFNSPLVSDAIATVSLSSTSGNCKIGGTTLGINSYMGVLQKTGLSNEGKGASTVTRDKYNEATLVKRPMIRVLSGVLKTPSYLIDAVLALREEMDAEPALYSGLDEDGDWTDAVSMVGVLQKCILVPTPGIEAAFNFLVEEI